METAVSVVLDWVGFSQPYSTGRLWKLAGLSEVSKRGGGPLLRPEPCPTAGAMPRGRRRSTFNDRQNGLMQKELS